MSQSTDFAASPAPVNVDLDVAMENTAVTAPADSVPASTAAFDVPTAADTPALGTKDSKYAPKPDVRAMLEQARQDASSLSLAYVALAQDDPSRPFKKAELDFMEDKVNTLTKTLTWQKKVPTGTELSYKRLKIFVSVDKGKKVLSDFTNTTGTTDARLVAQAPIFQIARIMECDPTTYRNQTMSQTND
ncbi:hypothetical protein [Absidia glauca]|uniref:Uncharacterized protein n=1 Tax=Absidia glauca TaxID=4829 RepID=A0A163JFB8_ABSGL|nr:hypothetical protein [Absidia glauca]